MVQPQGRGGASKVASRRVRSATAQTPTPRRSSCDCAHTSVANTQIVEDRTPGAGAAARCLRLKTPLRRAGGGIYLREPALHLVDQVPHAPRVSAAQIVGRKDVALELRRYPAR